MTITATRQGHSPIEGLPYITTLGREGLDCVAQVQGLLQLKPTWRAMIGTLLVYCQDDLQVTRPSYWQRPWVFHCWLVDADGVIRDPAARNLDSWAQVTSNTLPCPVEAMTAEVIPHGPETEAQINDCLNGPFNERPDNVLRYCPGAVLFLSKKEAKQPDPVQRIWAEMAYYSALKGGLTAAQFDHCMKLIPKRIALYQKQQRKSKGFG